MPRINVEGRFFVMSADLMISSLNSGWELLKLMLGRSWLRHAGTAHPFAPPPNTIGMLCRLDWIIRPFQKRVLILGRLDIDSHACSIR